MQKNARSHAPTRVRGMTQATANLIVEMVNVEDQLYLRGDREGLLLAAALAVYRSRLERKGGFVRLQPEHSLESLKFIEIQRGNGWLMLIDTRVKSIKK